MTRIIPRNLIRHLEWTPGTTLPPPPDDIRDTFAGTGSISVEDTGFMFHQLEVASGKYLDVLLQSSLLAGDATKTQPKHWEYVQKKKDGVVLPNGQLLYAMMHRAYTLRDKPAAAETLSSLRNLMKIDWESKYPHTGTRIDYVQGSLEATIQHLQPDGSVTPFPVAIPEFTQETTNWSYLILAQQQPAASLGVMEELPDNAHPFLETLLGPHYQDAGAVFQYMSSRKDDNLRQVRVWTPTLTNRADSRALVLGVNDGSGGFDISANDGIGISRPARGVAVGAKKTP